MQSLPHMNQYKQGKWVDYLTAHGYDVSAIYHSIINRIRGDPRRLMDQLQAKANNLLSIQPKVRHYLTTLSPYVKHQKILQHLLQNLQISHSHYTLFANRYLWHNFPQQQLFDYLQYHKIKLKVKQSRGQYQIIVMVTQGMQQNYRRYGDVVSISYHFVPLKRNRLLRCCYLGMIGGVNGSGDSVVFGMALVIGSNPQFKAEIIGYWVSLVKPQNTFSMIGQYSPYINQVIKIHNQTNPAKIFYYQNWFHTLQQAQKSLIAQPSRKHISSLLRKLLLTFNRQQSQLILHKINRLLTLKQNLRVVPSILQNTMSLLCKYPPRFVGFEIQVNKYNYIAELVQNQIAYCPKLGILIYRLLQFQKKMHTVMQKNKKGQLTWLMDKYHMKSVHEEFKQIANIMSQEMFRKLFYNYYIAINHCKLVQSTSPLQLKILELIPSKQAPPQTQIQSQNSPYVYNYTPTSSNGTNYNTQSSSYPNNNFSQHFPDQNQQHIQPNVPEQYIIKYSIRFDCWQCECKMIYWAGIPCSHLIHAVLRHKGSIKYYINSRWLNYQTTIPQFSTPIKVRKQQKNIVEPLQIQKKTQLQIQEMKEEGNNIDQQ